MKTPTIITAAAAALALIATSVGLSAHAQNDPQSGSSHGAVAPAPAAEPSAPAAVGAAAASAQATDAKLTKEESEQAEKVIFDKCTRCHGTEPIVALHQGKAEWQAVMENMGPAAEATKAESALIVRYLVENYGPPPKT